MCPNYPLSLRATEGSVAISLFSMHYEIASVVSLPRNDITTQSPKGEEDLSVFFIPPLPCLFLNALYLFYPCLFGDNPFCWLNNDILYVRSDPDHLDLTIKEYPGSLINDQGHCVLIELLPFVGIGGAPCRI